MFNGGVRMGGLDALEKFNRAEGVPLSMIYMVDDTRGDAYTYGLNVLKKYGGSSKTVTPDPDVIQFCQSLLGTSHAVAAQEVIDLIAASSNPPPLSPFKSIQSVTADAPSLNLPSTQTTLRANASDLAEGDLVYTWRKIHGAGNVTFTPNSTAAAKDTAIQYDAVPGNYLFEVTVSDSRGLTEVYGTVATTLRNPDGTLPANDPPAAIPQAVNAIPGSATPVTLTGTDPEGYPLVFTVTSQPANGTLSGSAPDLTYTANLSYLGPDSFTFQVMDSEGQTSSATVSINVSPAGSILAVHEPFDYAPGALNGKSGASEIGFSAPWHASTAQVIDSSLSYGSLPVSGGSIGNLNGGSNHYGGARALSASALAENGLLDDGATLWFSVIMGYGTNYALDPPVAANLTNARLALALANSGFNTGNYRYYINDEGSQPGSGLGVTLGRFNATNGKVVATRFQDASQGTSGWDGNVFGNVPVSTIGANSHRLVIGKITWGAESDTIELYEPDTSLNLNLPTSTLTVNVDQSEFDTITWARGDTVTMDEIRFGDSLAAVAGLNLTPADTEPPTLAGITDDRAGEAVPQFTPVTYTVSFSEMMDAATVSAASFANAGSAEVTIGTVAQTLPGIFSVQVTPATTGTLQLSIPAGALLTDSAGNPLDTAAAFTDDTTLTVTTALVDVPFVIGMTETAAGSEITGSGLVVGNIDFQYNANIPAGEVFGQVPAGGTSLTLGSDVNLTVSLGAPNTVSVPDLVGLTQAAAESAILSSNLVAGSITTQASDTVPAGTVISQNPQGGTDVNPGTAVDFLVSLGDTTPPSPDPMTFAVAPYATGDTSISMTATTATDANGVEYLFTNLTLGTASGWQDSPTYVDTGLEPATTYSYEVKARDKSANANETAASSPPAAATTDDAPSGPDSAVLYEPFDYAAGALGSASGGTGFSGNWSSSSATFVATSDLPYGDLPSTGNSIGNMAGGINRFGGARPVDLATHGLLADGGELWFSLIMGYDSGGNRTNSRLTFVLGTESMSGGNFQYYYNTAGATGLGVTLGRFGSNGRIVATQVRDSTFGTGFSGNVYGTGQTITAVPDSNGVLNIDYRLVVGRITWGASEDTIDIFLPDTNLNLGSVHSTLTVNVDQSGYDTISFARGDKVVMDEIRFGASFESVIGAGAPASPYADWSGGETADLDSNLDGVPNGIAWALGATDPDANAIDLLPTADSSDPDHFVFTFQRSDEAQADANTDITVEYGSDLSGWTTATDGVDGVDIDDSAIPAAGLRTVVVTIPKVLASDDKLFVRLNVVVTP
jgi:hypothetical protein